VKLLVFLGLVACGATQAAMGPEEARHLLGRTGFEARIQDIDVYARLSRGEAVDRLLAGALREARTPLPDGVAAWIPPSRFRQAQPEERKLLARDNIERGLALKGWWLGEMLATDSPLTERMTLFWHNHFTSSLQKVRSPALLARQNALLRRHALGSFAELLHAASKDPAMLVYLDVARSRRGQPNENFAREVMELFTLGEGRYAEGDIREAARAFTGWSLDPDAGEFLFRPALHDAGVKAVLGASGSWNGDDVLDILLAQPATAEFVTAKLWKEFVAPQPDQAEVRRIAQVFRNSRYSISAALREILLASTFWSPENRASLIKSPVELVVGTLRQFDIRVADPLPFALLLRALGQDLFAPPNVRGWPGNEAWISSQTLLARKQLLDRLMRVDETRAVMQERLDTLKPGARRVVQAMLEIDFSAAAWLRRFEGREDQIALVLLAAAPVSGASGSGADFVRSLVSDPVYQLK
jgi:uncharacterized protein (DUF1800 family)